MNETVRLKPNISENNCLSMNRIWAFPHRPLETLGRKYLVISLKYQVYELDSPIILIQFTFFCQCSQQSVNRAVDYQLFRKMHCIQHLQRVLMAQNITFHVRIAADDNLHTVMRTAFQYNRCIFTTVSAIAARSDRSLVQLNQHTMLLGMANQLVKINRICAVVRMTDDMHLRIFHRLEIGAGIFPRGLPGVMHTSCRLAMP